MGHTLSKFLRLTRAKVHRLRMAMGHALSKFLRLTRANFGWRWTCFVQTPSTYEGERPSAVDSCSVWPIDLVDRVRSILQLPIRQPSKPEFSFELSMESAEKNFLILTKKYGGSLKAALEGQHESPLGMGSEFRPIDILETIYGNHPIWSRMKNETYTPTGFYLAIRRSQ